MLRVLVAVTESIGGKKFAPTLNAFSKFYRSCIRMLLSYCCRPVMHLLRASLVLLVILPIRFQYTPDSFWEEERAWMCLLWDFNILMLDCMLTYLLSLRLYCKGWVCLQTVARSFALRFCKMLWIQNARAIKFAECIQGWRKFFFRLHSPLLLQDWQDRVSSLVQHAWETETNSWKTETNSRNKSL